VSDLRQSLDRIAPLTVPEAYAEGVAFWIDILAQHIALVAAVPIPDDVEPAPVFRA
jgi:hypothetical protein